jgi:hypothetical protein
MDQWNRIKDIKINPKTYVGEKTISSTNGVGKTGYPRVM